MNFPLLFFFLLKCFYTFPKKMAPLHNHYTTMYVCNNVKKAISRCWNCVCEDAYDLIVPTYYWDSCLCMWHSVFCVHKIQQIEFLLSLCTPSCDLSLPYVNSHSLIALSQVHSPDTDNMQLNGHHWDRLLFNQ